MSGIEAVVFDIGRVLIEWDPARMYDSEIGPERRKALFEEVDLDEMNTRVDMGAPFRETIYDKAERHPDWAGEIRLWHDHWIEMASPDIPQTVRLLRALRTNGVPVFALTNFGVGSFELAATHYPFFNEFDRAYVSGRLGMMKPDPRIYAAVEADSGVTPEALLFTDDKRENVDAARKRGWQGHVFEGPEGLAARLVSAGLLTEAQTA
jgi:2-haloacid dehalogenase